MAVVVGHRGLQELVTDDIAPDLCVDDLLGHFALAEPGDLHGVGDGPVGLIHVLLVLVGRDLDGEFDGVFIGVLDGGLHRSDKATRDSKLGRGGRLRRMYEHELSFANGLADRAADIGMGLFLGDGLLVRHKADRTVVTQADTSIEAMVREQVAAAFPDDHVLGEEEGGSAEAADRVWIVDPIDATANYARGIPVWATLIALQVHGDLVMGIVSAPALHERYEAARGHGARMNDRPIKVSEIGSSASPSCSTPA